MEGILQLLRYVQENDLEIVYNVMKIMKTIDLFEKAGMNFKKI